MPEKTSEMVRVVMPALAGAGSVGTSFVEQVQPWITATAGAMTVIWLAMNMVTWARNRSWKKKETV